MFKLLILPNIAVHIEIGGPNPGLSPSDHDQINVTGEVGLGFVPVLLVDLVNGFEPTENQQFVIVNIWAA